MTLKMEYISCPLCGSDISTQLLVRGDLMFFVPGEFVLVKCNECGLVYQNPRPALESFNQIYPTEYRNHIEIENLKKKNLFVYFQSYGLKKRVKEINKIKRGGKILDVGCATGDFLYEISKTGKWEVFGVEPSSFECEVAQSKYGLIVFNGYLENSDFKSGTFDVITLWNVIEHLPDPIKTLKKINELLKEDGILIVNTPNLDCLDQKIFKQYWIGYELPRHFVVFSRNTLKGTLRKSGFNVIRTKAFFGSHALAMSSLRFLLRDINYKLIIPRHIMENILFSFPVRILLAPLFFILDKLLLTTAPVDFCEKKHE